MGTRLGDRGVEGDLRTVLVIGGGPDAVPLVRGLRRLPVRVVVADGRPDAPAFRAADGGLIAATLDVESTIEAARTCASRTRIDAVMATARPLAVTAAAVADALGTLGPPLGAAALLADRLATARCLHDAGVPTAAAQVVESPTSLAALVSARAAPVVVKPVDGWGARGVVRIGPGEDLAWAYRVAAAVSPSGRVLAQRDTPGRALAAVALVIDGTPVLLDVCERSADVHARFAPFVIDAGHQSACAVDDPDGTRLAALLAAVANATGVRDTLLTVEVRESDGELAVVDAHIGFTDGRRLAYGIPLASGIDALAAVVALITGERPAPSDLAPRWHRWVAERGCFPEPGTVVEVAPLGPVRDLDGVALVDVSVRPGGRIVARTSNACRGGTIVATGPSAVVAAERAARAAARVRIVTR